MREKALGHFCRCNKEFLKSSFNVAPEKIHSTLKQFLEKIKHLEKNPFETRSFAYLDTISWVESKVYNKPLSTVIAAKFQKKQLVKATGQ